jgi:methionine synthase I (cobalamin-dependent)
LEVQHVNFREAVASAPQVLLDGAIGTELQRRGLPAGECPDSWNLTHPDTVAEIARSYAVAGSQAILTTTFRANSISLAPYGLAGQVRDINVAGAALARRGAAGRAFVLGSVGPTGELLALDESLRDQVLGVFEQQCNALSEGGVDAIVLETFSDVAEAELALEAANRTGLPVIVSFAFDTGKNKDRTMTGATPEQVAQRITSAGAFAVGANCGVGIDGYIGICRRMRAATSLPLWIKPNAGMPEMIDGEIHYRTTPAEFAARVPELLDAGAKLVGACCGSTPDFIRAMADVIAGRQAAGKAAVQA